MNSTVTTLVVVNIYPSRIDAEVDKSLLAANGIETFISADDAGGMYPSPLSPKYGVELKVSQKDLKKAKKILSL